MLFFALYSPPPSLWLARNIFNHCSAPEPEDVNGVEGGGMNPCDAGLDLSGSLQQGHSATYNTPSRI